MSTPAPASRRGCSVTTTVLRCRGDTRDQPLSARPAGRVGLSCWTKPPGHDRSLESLIPILGWIRHYDRGWLRGDVIAGETAAALIVPKNLGYAGDRRHPAGARPLRRSGGGDLYAIFGTCRHISAAQLGPGGGGSERRGRHGHRRPPAGRELRRRDHARLGSRVPLMAVARLGWIARFLSRAVVTGFLFGAAIDVVIGELPKLTGTETRGTTPGRSSGPGSAPWRRPGVDPGPGHAGPPRRLRAAGGRPAGAGRPGPRRRGPDGIVAPRPG